MFAQLKGEVLQLLDEINNIEESQFTKRLERIYARDDVAGPLACAHLFSRMKKACPAREEDFWQHQIDKCQRAAKVSLRIRRGWEPFGKSAYDVVFAQRQPWFPRYHSEPLLNGAVQRPA